MTGPGPSVARDCLTLVAGLAGAALAIAGLLELIDLAVDLFLP